MSEDLKAIARRTEIEQTKHNRGQSAAGGEQQAHSEVRESRACEDTDNAAQSADHPKLPRAVQNMTNTHREIEASHSRGYLIRIAKREERVRAMGILGDVPIPFHSCADDEFVVLGAHIKALQEGKIDFQDITKRPVTNG